jgi:aryl-alcohol dehydrogenase-like predicted oxidoreductase
MQYREFGRTGWRVSAISFGAWAIGGDWGHVSDEDALDALRAGIDLIDTADVYGDGRSERLISNVLKEQRDQVYVITKAGRRLKPHVADGYNRDNLNAFVDRSLKNLDVETIDLVQLHCPPTDVYYRPEVFGILDDMVAAGKIRYYGVSVEKVEEAIKALEYPNLQSVQIIFNMFRQRPAELLFDLAKQRRVAVLARVPLASGLLTGKMTAQSVFPADDHRNYNRQGAAFDVGETFAGIDFQAGLDAVELLRPLVPAGITMTQFALRWILMFDAVSCAIPSAKNRLQATQNAQAADFPPLSPDVMARVGEVYRQHIKSRVHQRW